VSWNPDQYERFKAERKQPFVDLLALVEHRPNMRVLDLGCGTGELTRELHETLGARATVGVDNSEAMLAKACSGGGEHWSFALATSSRSPPISRSISSSRTQRCTGSAIITRS